MTQENRPLVFPVFLHLQTESHAIEYVALYTCVACLRKRSEVIQLSKTKGKSLMLGNEAVARAAYEAGVVVATAYPGTPSTEITENIAKYPQIYCEWSPNEKVALEVAIGAAFTGARAMCSMKHVGLNVAADPLFTASYTGIGSGGGLVVMVADDPGMHSSQNEQDSRLYGLAAKIPVLEPSDSQECLDFVKEAFRISEEYDTPVMVRLTTRVSHSRSLVGEGEREERAPSGFKKDIGKYVMMPAMARRRHAAVEARMRRLEAFAEETWLNRVERVGEEAGAGNGSSDGPGGPASSASPGGPDGPGGFGVLTSGLPYQYAIEALEGAMEARASGGVPVLKLGLAHPLPRKRILNFAKDNGRLLVVEELSPFIENFAAAAIGSDAAPCAAVSSGSGMRPRIVGKELLPAVGELSAKILQDALFAFAQTPAPEAAQAPSKEAAPAPEAAQAPSAKSAPVPLPAPQPAPGPLPARPPVLCPGCPHRGVFYVLKRLKLTVCGDIGCYTLGAMPPLEALDTCVCMGAAIGVAHGMEKALGAGQAQKTVAVIGDSTFIHSGITGLLDIVYNKGCATVLILDNSITGMTGHQQNPATGRTIRGEETARLDLVKLCGALGVPNVRVVDAFDVAALEAAVKEETQRAEPSAIIVRRPCALLKEYKPELAYARINPAKCTRCKRCMGISCAAISVQEKTMVIDAALCVRCGLCARVCAFNAIETAPAAPTSPPPVALTPPAAPLPSAEPTPPADGLPPERSAQ